MALIKCPECGKEISDTAKNCIHCGYALKEDSVTSPQQTIIHIESPKKTKFSSKYLISGITLFLIALIISVFNSLSGDGVNSGSEGEFVLLNASKISSVVSFIFSIILLAIPKIRKKLVVILYLIANLASAFFIINYSAGTGGCDALTFVPQLIGLFVSYILIFISLFIKDEKQ